MDVETSKILTESNKRIQDLQTKLGITRDQRTGIINQIDGNVANLSVSLDDKIKQYDEEKKKELEEELRMIEIRSQEIPINQIPSLDQIENILNGSEEVSFDKEEIKRSQMKIEQPDLKKEDTKPLEDGGIVL